MRYTIPIILALTVLVGCHSPSKVHTASPAAITAAPPKRVVPFRPIFITTHGTNDTVDGAWRIAVSDSLLAISRSHASSGEGWTGSGWSTVSPDGWKAQAGWFVFVENESRVWAYDGNRKLLLQTETSSGVHFKGATYSSRYPCAVPEQVFARLTEPAQRKVKSQQ